MCCMTVCTRGRASGGGSSSDSLTVCRSAPSCQHDGHTGGDQQSRRPLPEHRQGLQGHGYFEL